MKCFHHNDLDGKGAGAIVAMFENNYNPSDFFEVDYVQALPLDKISKDEKVYFVDYSFSVNTENVLREILKITGNIVWIDHHQSSVKLLNKRIDLKSISGIVREGISGAALTYMYLYGVSFEDLPLYLKYISDYDCWHLKLPRVMEFKYGVDSYDYSVLSDFWLRIYEHDSKSSNDFLDDIMNKGSIIKGYCEKQYEKNREENSYEAVIEGHKALVLNVDGFSGVFGEKIHEYDVCLIWHYNGKKYVYSIYSDGTVDVSKIAEKFGGGGHPGASGFSSDKLLFR